MAKENNRVHELRLIIEMGARDEAWNYENKKTSWCVLNEQSNKSNDERGDSRQLSVLKRKLRILTNKYHYKTEITFN